MISENKTDKETSLLCAMSVELLRFNEPMLNIYAGDDIICKNYNSLHKISYQTLLSD